MWPAHVRTHTCTRSHTRSLSPVVSLSYTYGSHSHTHSHSRSCPRGWRTTAASRIPGKLGYKVGQVPLAFDSFDFTSRLSVITCPQVVKATAAKVAECISDNGKLAYICTRRSSVVSISKTAWLLIFKAFQAIRISLNDKKK